MGASLMAMIYIVGGAVHFYAPGFYRQLMPPVIPKPTFIIYLSGVIEIALGLMLFWPATRPLAAWGILAFLIAVLPVHIYMIQERNTKFRHIYRSFIFLRPVLQVALMYWAYLYT